MTVSDLDYWRFLRLASGGCRRLGRMCVVDLAIAAGGQPLNFVHCQFMRCGRGPLPS
jgi:hypothetical protein